MPLIVFRARDESEIESFSIGEAQWNARRQMPLMLAQPITQRQ